MYTELCGRLEPAQGERRVCDVIELDDYGRLLYTLSPGVPCNPTALSRQKLLDHRAGVATTTVVFDLLSPLSHAQNLNR